MGFLKRLLGGQAAQPKPPPTKPTNWPPPPIAKTTSRGIEISVGEPRQRSSGSRSSRPPLELSAHDSAVLQPATLDPAWPVLPRRPQWSDFDSQRNYVPVDQRPYKRPYNRTTCPHCDSALKPLPKAKKKCPSCGQEIFVRSGPDGVRHLLTAAQVPAHEEAWGEAQRAAGAEASARLEVAEEEYAETLGRIGILTGEWEPEVVGESHCLRELASLMLALKPGPGGGEVHVVAELMREPKNQYDRNAIAVIVHGLRVGHLQRDEAEDYQPLLMGLERKGHRALVEASLVGGRPTPAGGIGPIGVQIAGMPDPD